VKVGLPADLTRTEKVSDPEVSALSDWITAVVAGEVIAIVGLAVATTFQ
jgi:hypothetical protein